jgi:hypothetical protein
MNEQPPPQHHPTGLNGASHHEEPIVSVTISYTTAGRLLTDLVRHDGGPINRKVVAAMMLDATSLFMGNALTSARIEDPNEMVAIRLPWLSKWLTLSRTILDGEPTVTMVASSLDALSALLQVDQSVRGVDVPRIVSPHHRP